MSPKTCSLTRQCLRKHEEEDDSPPIAEGDASPVKPSSPGNASDSKADNVGHLPRFDQGKVTKNGAKPTKKFENSTATIDHDRKIAVQVSGEALARCQLHNDSKEPRTVSSEKFKRQHFDCSIVVVDPHQIQREGDLVAGSSPAAMSSKPSLPSRSEGDTATKENRKQVYFTPITPKTLPDEIPKSQLFTGSLVTMRPKNTTKSRANGDPVQVQDSGLTSKTQTQESGFVPNNATSKKRRQQSGFGLDNATDIRAHAQDGTKRTATISKERLAGQTPFDSMKRTSGYSRQPSLITPLLSSSRKPARKVSPDHFYHQEQLSFENIKHDQTHPVDGTDIIRIEGGQENNRNTQGPSIRQMIAYLQLQWNEWVEDDLPSLLHDVFFGLQDEDAMSYYEHVIAGHPSLELDDEESIDGMEEIFFGGPSQAPVAICNDDRLFWEVFPWKQWIVSVVCLVIFAFLLHRMNAIFLDPFHLFSDKETVEDSSILMKLAADTYEGVRYVFGGAKKSSP